jgi:hypothetical protein
MNPKKDSRYFRYLSCIVQGILPYGAQVLILSFANGKLDFFDLISNANHFFIRFYFSSYL